MQVVFFVPNDPEYASGGANPPNPYAYHRVMRAPDFAALAAYLDDTVFPQLMAFHAREFGSRSQLRFRIARQPVYGRESREHYEKDFLTSLERIAST